MRKKILSLALAVLMVVSAVTPSIISMADQNSYTLIDNGRGSGYFNKLSVSHDSQTFPAFCLDPYVDYNENYPHYTLGASLSSSHLNAVKWVANNSNYILTTAQVNTLWGMNLTADEMSDAAQLAIWNIVTDGAYIVPDDLLSTPAYNFYQMLSSGANEGSREFSMSDRIGITADVTDSVTVVDIRTSKWGPFSFSADIDSSSELASYVSSSYLELTGLGSCSIVDTLGNSVPSNQIRFDTDYWVQFDSTESHDLTIEVARDPFLDFNYASSFVTLESPEGPELIQSIGYPVAAASTLDLSIRMESTAKSDARINVTINNFSSGEGDDSTWDALTSGTAVQNLPITYYNGIAGSVSYLDSFGVLLFKKDTDTGNWVYANSAMVDSNTISGGEHEISRTSFDVSSGEYMVLELFPSHAFESAPDDGSTAYTYKRSTSDVSYSVVNEYTSGSVSSTSVTKSGTIGSSGIDYSSLAGGVKEAFDAIVDDVGGISFKATTFQVNAGDELLVAVRNNIIHKSDVKTVSATLKKTFTKGGVAGQTDLFNFNLYTGVTLNTGSTKIESATFSETFSMNAGGVGASKILPKGMIFVVEDMLHSRVVGPVVGGESSTITKSSSISPTSGVTAWYCPKNSYNFGSHTGDLSVWTKGTAPQNGNEYWVGYTFTPTQGSTYTWANVEGTTVAKEEFILEKEGYCVDQTFYAYKTNLSGTILESGTFELDNVDWDSASADILQKLPGFFVSGPYKYYIIESIPQRNNGTTGGSLERTNTSSGWVFNRGSYETSEKFCEHCGASISGRLYPAYSYEWEGLAWVDGSIQEMGSFNSYTHSGTMPSMDSAPDNGPKDNAYGAVCFTLDSLLDLRMIMYNDGRFSNGDEAEDWDSHDCPSVTLTKTNIGESSGIGFWFDIFEKTGATWIYVGSINKNVASGQTVTVGDLAKDTTNFRSADEPVHLEYGKTYMIVEMWGNGTLDETYRLTEHQTTWTGGTSSGWLDGYEPTGSSFLTTLPANPDMIYWPCTQFVYDGNKTIGVRNTVTVDEAQIKSRYLSVGKSYSINNVPQTGANKEDFDFDISYAPGSFDDSGYPFGHLWTSPTIASGTGYHVVMEESADYIDTTSWEPFKNTGTYTIKELWDTSVVTVEEKYLDVAGKWVDVTEPHLGIKRISTTTRSTTISVDAGGEWTYSSLFMTDGKYPTVTAQNSNTGDASSCIVYFNNKETTTVTYDFSGVILLKKSDADTGATVNGGTYRITLSSMGTYQDVTLGTPMVSGSLIHTSLSSYWVIGNLTNGAQYTVEEIVAPPSYDLDPVAANNIKPVTPVNTTDYAAIAKVEFSNWKTVDAPWYGTVTLRKFSQLSEPLNNGVFEIRLASDHTTVVDTITMTDSNTGTSKRLKIDIPYAVYETVAPDGVSELTVPKLVGSFTLTEGTLAERSITLDITNVQTTEVSIFKHDRKNVANSLAGATFEMRSIDAPHDIDNPGAPVATVTTDELGKTTIPIDIPLGNYILVETMAPTGYYPLSSPIQLYLNSVSGKVIHIFDDRIGTNYTGKINLVKTGVGVDASGLDGVTYELWVYAPGLEGEDSEGYVFNTSDTTTDGGKLSFENLVSGQYKLIEVNAPEGYVVDPTPIYAVLASDSSIVNKTASNIKAGSITVVKEDENGDGLPGTVFVFCDVDGNSLAVSDIDGTALPTIGGFSKLTESVVGNVVKHTAKMLPIGTYYVKEYSTIQDYILDSEIHTISVSNTTVNQTITVVNRPIPEGSLQVKKMDSSDHSIFLVATFDVRNSSNVSVGTLTTKASDGLSNVLVLEPGTYVLYETGVPEHYSASAPITVVVSDKTALVKDIFNTPIPHLYDLALQKMITKVGNTTISDRLVNNAPVTVKPGDKVTYTITVYNQGDTVARPEKIVDFVDSRMIFNPADNAGWSKVGSYLMYDWNPDTLLEPGSSVTISVVLQVPMDVVDGLRIDNWAMIVNTIDEDGNSVVDTDSGNSGNPSEVDKPGKTPHDIEEEDGSDCYDGDEVIVRVDPVRQLALQKYVTKVGTTVIGDRPSNTAPVVVKPGDKIEFSLKVYNLGTANDAPTTITDFLGWRGNVLTFSAADNPYWTLSGGYAVFDWSTAAAAGVVPANIEPNGSAIAKIVLTVPASVSRDMVISNWAEVNDGNSEDNSSKTQHDVGTPGTETYDWDTIIVPTDPVYDLALTKAVSRVNGVSVGARLSGAPPQKTKPGDIVEFTLTIYNQGNVPVRPESVMDYLGWNGNSLEFDNSLNPGWRLVGNYASFDWSLGSSLGIVSKYIQPGNSVAITIKLRVPLLAVNGVVIDNYAEVAGLLDSDDVSKSDSDSTNNTSPIDNGNKNSQHDTTAKDGSDNFDYDRIVVEVLKGGISWKKTDGETGDLLSGAQFSLTRAGTNVVVKTGITSASGTFRVEDLDYGDYYLTETRAPEGYELRSTGIFVTVNATSVDYTYVFKNYKEEEPTGIAEVLKVDSVSKNGIENVTFTVFNSRGEQMGTLRSGISGRTQRIELPLGVYYVRETSTPDGYYENNQSYDLVLTVEGSLKTITVENTKIPVAPPEVVTPPEIVTPPVTRNASYEVTIDKSLSFGQSPEVGLGDVVSFDILVTNTGEDPLTGVRVTDSLDPSWSYYIGDLAVGESRSVEFTCVAIGENVTRLAKWDYCMYNTATVSTNETPPAEDIASVSIHLTDEEMFELFDDDPPLGGLDFPEEVKLPKTGPMSSIFFTMCYLMSALCGCWILLLNKDRWLLKFARD